MPTANQLRRDALNGRLLALAEEDAACLKALNTAIDPLAAAKLKLKRKEIREEMGAAEAELGALDRRNPARPAEPAWPRHLPRIDFAAAHRRFDAVQTRLAGDGGATCYLFQNGTPKCGDLLARRLFDHLSADPARAPVEPRRYAVQFQAIETPGAPLFLERLAGHLKAGPGVADLDAFAESLAGLILRSLTPGSLGVIELTFTNKLDLRRDFLPWVLEKFWRKLVDGLAKRVRPWPKVVFLIHARSRLDLAALPAGLVRDADKFDECGVHELDLGDWDAEEIKRWLRVYAVPEFGLTEEEIQAMGDRIHEASEGGMPRSVRSALEDELRQLEESR